MISQELINYFKLLAEYTKASDSSSRESLWENINNIDENQFAIEISDIKQQEEESLLDYFERLKAHKKLLNSYLLQLNSYCQKINEFRKNFNQVINLSKKFTNQEMKIFDLKTKLINNKNRTELKLKSLKGCNLILISTDILFEDLSPKEGFLYLKTDGTYKCCYNDQIFEDSLAKTNPEIKIPLPSNSPLDADFVDSVLKITSMKNHSAKRGLSELKNEVKDKIRVIPNSLTLEIWYLNTLDKMQTILGFPSSAHISIDFCDSEGRSHYVSFYSVHNPEHTFLTDHLHIPSYKTVPGLFHEKTIDILDLISNSKFVEHQKVVFNCEENPEIKLENAIAWAKKLLSNQQAPDFNFYSHNCSHVGFAGLLAAGFGEILPPPDSFVLSAQEVFDYAKSVKNYLNKENENQANPILTKSETLEKKLLELIGGPTNSSGILKMQKLGSRISLSAFQKIVRANDGVGFFKKFNDCYAHSHIIGEGRKKWVDELYKFLRIVNAEDDTIEALERNLNIVQNILLTKKDEIKTQRETKGDVLKAFSFQR